MRREWSAAIALVALAIALAIVAPSFFSVENLRDLFLVNLPVLVVAIGATLVILTGEIDISVGSAFAVCGVVAMEIRTGEIYTFHAKAVLFATGGYGRAWKVTSNAFACNRLKVCWSEVIGPWLVSISEPACICGGARKVSSTVG